MLLYMTHIIDHTETEKLLTSPSTPSTSMTSVTSPPSHLYYSHSWIPHNIEISLEENGEMSVQKISEPRNELTNDASAQMSVVENGQDDKIARTVSDNVEDNNDEDCNNIENCNIVSNAKGSETKSTNSKISKNTQKIHYSLSAVVCYIDDKNNEERRNIVTLLRVGPNYHVRSSGNPVSQWYIFNDFW